MLRQTPRVAGPQRTATTLILLLAAVALVAACSGAAVPILSDTGTAIGIQDGSGAEAAPLATQEGAFDGAGSVGPGRDEAAARDDALIVRSAQLGLQVADVDDALAKAQQAIGALGGYIGASTRSTVEEHPVATITYRVPVERWDEALTMFRGLADEVLTEQTDAVEVTAQAVDLDARLKNLRATETALQGVLEKAVKIPDILEVQAQLSTVREQIEVLVAQRTELGDRAALGTISVAFGTEVVAVTQATESWDPASEVDRASATLVDFVQGLASAGIWFAIVWLPVLAVLAVIALIAAFAIRRSGILRRPVRPAPLPTPAE